VLIMGTRRECKGDLLVSSERSYGSVEYSHERFCTFAVQSTPFDDTISGVMFNDTVGKGRSPSSSVRRSLASTSQSKLRRYCATLLLTCLLLPLKLTDFNQALVEPNYL
jgi:hypothetical protein